MQSGRDLHCLPSQYKDHVEDTGLIAQTALCFRHSYMPPGPFYQPADQTFVIVDWTGF